jgi:hypothetical protein
MIRRKPDTVEDVIELRIAVVGNGMLWFLDLGGCEVLPELLVS